MRPTGDYILNTIAKMLEEKFVPMLESDHAKSEMVQATRMMAFVAQEFNRAANRRIEENEALRKLFSEALLVVEDQNFKGRLKALSEKSTEDYSVEALDKLNCELLEALIDLHVAIEGTAGEDARKIETAIWDELERGVNRRAFILG